MHGSLFERLKVSAWLGYCSTKPLVPVAWAYEQAFQIIPITPSAVSVAQHSQIAQGTQCLVDHYRHDRIET